MVTEASHLLQTVEVMVTAMVEVVEPVSMLVTPPVVWVLVTGQMVVDCETMTVVTTLLPAGGVETTPEETGDETCGVETTPEEAGGVETTPEVAGDETGTVGAVVGLVSVTGQMVVETAMVKVVRAVD